MVPAQTRMLRLCAHFLANKRDAPHQRQTPRQAGHSEKMIDVKMTVKAALLLPPLRFDAVLIPGFPSPGCLTYTGAQSYGRGD